MNHKTLPSILCALIIVWSSTPTVATAQAAPDLTDILKASDIFAAGYVVSGYTENLNHGNIVSYHLFDADGDTFKLNQAALILAHLPEQGFGAKAVLVGGTDAKLLNAFYGSDSSDLALFIAELQYASGPLTVIAGRYPALSGAEVALAPLNTNISRSLVLTLAQPVPLTGVRALLKAGDALTLALGVANSNSFGTAAAVDDNPQKTLEVGFAFTPIPAFKLSVYDYVSREAAANGGKVNYVDLVCSYKATERLSLSLNGDYKTVDGGNTKGGAAYLSYQFSPGFATALRVEHVWQAAPGVSNTLRLDEVTLTGTYTLSSTFRLLAEVRHDHASRDVFSDGSSANDALVFKRTGGTVALSAVYSFGGI